MARICETELERLLQNGQDNLHICPDCFAAGRRKHLCRNMVFSKSKQAIVCCYLGDKDFISAAEFEKKVLEMKNV